MAENNKYVQKFLKLIDGNLDVVFTCEKCIDGI